jgi:hypothetical protein
MTSLLEKAADQDKRKSAMLDELRVAAKAEREAIGAQKELLRKDQEQLDSYKQLKEQELLSIKK